MAYTKVRRKTMPIPVEPAVLAVHLISPAGTTVDIPVYIPWESCKLTYAYTVTTVAEGNDAAVGIDLELDAASGTAIGTVTVAQNASVGDLDEIVFAATPSAAGENLSALISGRDQINLEVTGDNTTATWQGMLYLYFEPWEGE